MVQFCFLCCFFSPAVAIFTSDSRFSFPFSFSFSFSTFLDTDSARHSVFSLDFTYLCFYLLCFRFAAIVYEYGLLYSFSYFLVMSYLLNISVHLPFEKAKQKERKK